MTPDRILDPARWVVLAASLAMAAPLPVSAEDTSWETDLRDQMGYDYECEIDFLDGVELRSVEGAQEVLARVHCKDSRIYKVNRVTDYEDFVVAPCEGAEGTC
jgi:hypothetical protein